MLKLTFLFVGFGNPMPWFYAIALIKLELLLLALLLRYPARLGYGSAIYWLIISLSG